MKKIFLSVLLGLCVLMPSLAQQDPYDAIRQDPRRALGVFNLYNFDTPAPAAAPKGYKAFYISHYGRHGSRMSSYSTTYDTMLKMLTDAHKKGNLTQRGEDYYSRFIPLYPKLKLRGGDLTTRGQAEQHELARRMYTNYPTVFKKGITATASSTNAPRAMMSMYAFLDGLRQNRPDIVLNSSASQADVIPLNPFTTVNPDCSPTDQGFVNDYCAWLDQWDAFRTKHMNPEGMLKNVFKDITKLSKYGQPIELEQMFYEIAECAQCMLDEKPMIDIFDMDELCHMWECNSLKYYLSKGPAPHSNGRQWAFIWRTMQDVINRADKAIQDNKPVIDLRFGHDITIMSLMTLLDIDGWNKAVSDDQAMYYWQEYRVPMAANFQFIFYKNKDNDVLVRFMLNEVDQKLPIASNTAPYYKWEDLKAYALKRIDVAKDILKNTTPPPKKAGVKNRHSSLG